MQKTSKLTGKGKSDQFSTKWATMTNIYLTKELIRKIRKSRSSISGTILSSIGHPKFLRRPSTKARHCSTISTPKSARRFRKSVNFKSQMYAREMSSRSVCSTLSHKRKLRPSKVFAMDLDSRTTCGVLCGSMVTLTALVSL